MASVMPLDKPYTVVCDSSDQETWLASRSLGIGASEVAAVLGVSPWESPYSLWCRKSGESESVVEQTEAIRWGHRLESAIAEEFAARTGRKIDKAGQLLRSTQYEWAIATPDFWVEINGAWRPLEIKNVREFAAEDWRDGAPEHYRLQVQAQMLVTGDSVATVAACIGGNELVWEDIKRDESVIARIVRECSDMWQRIKAGHAPAPDSHRATLRAQQLRYANPEPTVVELPNDTQDLADEYEHLGEQIKALESRRDGVKALIQEALGNAEIGTMRDGRRFSWKLQRRAQCVIPASETRVLKLLKAKASQ